MSDEVLYALGAKGSLTLNTFTMAFSELCMRWGELEKNRIDGRKVMRKGLRLLQEAGHCEVDPEGRKILACPPSIVSLPEGTIFRTAFVGARSPNNMRIIQDFVNKNKNDLALLRQGQSLKFLTHGEEVIVANLPYAITIEALDPEKLRQLSEQAKISLSIDMPAAWKLVNYSVNLEEYQNGLPLRERELLNWKSKVFDPDSLSFKEGLEVSDDCLIEYTNRVDNQKLYYLLTGEGSRIVGRDWGIYLLLSTLRKCVLLYDSAAHILGVPLRTPLPTVLAKAATMCSSQVPTPANLGDASAYALPQGTGIELYKGVPPEYASILSKKVSQNLIGVNLKPLTKEW